MVGKNVPSRHGTACCCRRLRAGGCSANAYCAAGQALLSVPVPATQAAPPCAMRGARSLASAAPRSPTSRSPPPAPVAPAGARLASGLAAPPQPRRPALLPLLLYTLAAALLPVAAGRGGAPKPRVHIYDLPEALFPRSAEDSFTAVLRASKYYEADHTKADLFWIPHTLPLPGGTAWAPRVMAHIAATWPYVNRSIAARQTRHYLTLFNDHGPGFTGYVEHPIRAEDPTGLVAPWWGPASPDRVVGHLQYNGVRDGPDAGQGECLVCFRSGLDVMLPIGQDNSCGPLCGYSRDTLAKWRAAVADPRWNEPQGTAAAAAAGGGTADADGVPAFGSAAYGRRTVVFYAGRVGQPGDKWDPSGRAPMLQLHAGRPGWRLANTAAAGADLSSNATAAAALAAATRDVADRTLFRNYAREAAGAEFCFSPLGQSLGPTDRFVAAALLGCIPVMLSSTFHGPPGKGSPVAQPFDEVLDWPSFAVLVRSHDLAGLHTVIEAIAPARRAKMRAALAAAAPRLLYTSIYGAIVGESGEHDAFETAMEVLRGRVARMRALPGG